METDSCLTRTSSPRDSIGICKVMQLASSFLSYYTGDSLGGFGFTFSQSHIQ